MRLLQRLAEDVAELGLVESAPRQDGRNMIMVLSPLKKKSEARADARAVKARLSAEREADREAERESRATRRPQPVAAKKSQGHPENLDATV